MERCSSTRSRTCLLRRRQSSCAPSRISRLSVLAVAAPDGSTPGSSSRPTVRCRDLVEQGTFPPGPVLPAERHRRAGAAASPAQGRCAGARAIFSRAVSARSSAGVCRPASPTRFSPTPGQATCGNSNGSSSERLRLRRQRRSNSRICRRRCSTDTVRCCCRRLHAGESMRAWGSRYARLVLERCAQQQASGLPRARASPITRFRDICASGRSVHYSPGTYRSEGSPWRVCRVPPATTFGEATAAIGRRSRAGLSLPLPRGSRRSNDTQQRCAPMARCHRDRAGSLRLRADALEPRRPASRRSSGYSSTAPRTLS